MDSIERAVERTVLASRCLDGAAEDLRALGKQNRAAPTQHVGTPPAYRATDA